MDEDDLSLLGVDDYDDIDLLGDEDDELGLRFASLMRSRAVRGGTSRRGRARALAKALVPRIPGSPRQGAREWALGFNVVTFDTTSGTSLDATANPQRAFKGSRLVVDIARSNAGLSASGLVTIEQLFIGQTNQLVSAQSVSAGAFAPGAFHTSLSLDPATPGVDITVGFAISVAPTVAGDQVDVGTTLIGIAMG